ncbi:hypothetical protein [Paraclostridium sp. AKS73]|nr:hypothetical protein [Paraclostridium sp. AKS73]MCU9815850.1 hypothetical protein [Paraclostridium sp. AKS73]
MKNSKNFISDSFEKIIIKNQDTKEIIAEINNDEIIPAIGFEIILVPKVN